MPYRVCKTIEIENGHMLSKHPDKCQFPHGHTRKVEFVLEADELDGNEMVCDFKIVKSVIDDYLQTFDHAMCVNTADPMFATLREAYGERVIGFENQDPTTELLAKTFYDAFLAKLDEYREKPNPRYPLRPDIRIVKVRVWETSSSWAEYFATPEPR
jgi:6-pyruvoyltetrahydropterin/6-carboxytetrahydropterin synthase